MNKEYITIPLEKERYKTLQRFMESDEYRNPDELTECWKHFGRDRTKLNGCGLMVENAVVNRGRETRLAHDCDFLKNHGLDKGGIRRRLKAAKGHIESAIRTLVRGEYFELISNTGHIWKGKFDRIQYHDLLELEVKSMASIKACHLFNRFKPYLDKAINMQNPRLIEIGCGSGWLAKVIKERYPQMRFTFVDLPTSIPYAYANLSKWFPDSKICMPHETYYEDWDFKFVTPNQVNLIDSDMFDFAIQVHGFQEMLPETIDSYFRLLRRVLKKENSFLCCNRTEKLMKAENLYIRFHEYPWSKNDRAYFLRDDEFFRGRKSCITKVCELSKQ